MPDPLRSVDADDPPGRMATPADTPKHAGVRAPGSAWYDPAFVRRRALSLAAEHGLVVVDVRELGLRAKTRRKSSEFKPWTPTARGVLRRAVRLRVTMYEN